LALASETVRRSNRTVENETFFTDAFGYRKMLAWTTQRTGDPARPCWVIEGTGSFGKGLTTHLLE
jgi:hypothetical protein